MQHATNDTLAKDLYTLAGQFSGFEGQMDEIRALMTKGFTDLDRKVDAKFSDLDRKVETKFNDLEARLRVTETAHAERKATHRTISWVIDLAKVIVAAVAGAAGGHFLK